MKTYIASHLSEGNRVFASKIIIDDLGVTLKAPKLFAGNEKTIPFSRISSVNIICPFLGFSTIILETTGEGKIDAYGFTKNEVKEMKETILNKIKI